MNRASGGSMGTPCTVEPIPRPQILKQRKRNRQVTCVAMGSQQFITFQKSRPTRPLSQLFSSSSSS